jgi:hypothetical protein
MWHIVKAEPAPAERLGSRGTHEGGWNIEYRNHEFQRDASRLVEKGVIERCDTTLHY